MNNVRPSSNRSMARFVVQVCCALTVIQGSALPVPGGTRSDLLKQSETTVMSSFIKSPLVFERNEGQTNPEIKFVSRGRDFALALTSNQALVLLHKPTPSVSADEGLSRFDGDDPIRFEDEPEAFLRMEFPGANPTPRVSGVGELVGKCNYFIGKDPLKWQSRVATYSQVRYESIYDGIDLLFYGHQNQLEFDYLVFPGADLNRIVLSFEGAESLEIEDDGNLLVRTGCGRLRLRAPIVYQKAGTEKEMIPGRYVMKGENQVGFKIAPYDHSRVLILDPVLEYSTYLGGISNDVIEGVALDDDGNIYVTGSTSSPDFPTKNAVQDAGNGRRSDVFVTKLNPTGSTVIYSTYLGGFLYETGRDIAVDAAGNAYVTGQTDSPDYPLLNPIQDEFRFTDAFVTKLNSTGDSLVFSTYLGGSDWEYGNGIAVDSSGRAHIGGNTSSTDFPVANALQAIFGGGFSDGFVTKLNADGSEFVYSTFLGGSGVSGEGNDFVNDIAVDSSGNAYVTGITESTDFPTANPIWGGDKESDDAFVAKLDGAGSLVYSTYLGGDSDDEAHGIAVDGNGNAYVTGETLSTDFPTVNAFQADRDPPWGAYAFVTKLNSTGGGYAYSTYLGGSMLDSGNAIAVDSAGNAYVAGRTGSEDFPIHNAIQSAPGGFLDVFVTKINPGGGTLGYSTYLGGSGEEAIFFDLIDIAVDSSGTAYVTGETSSVDFPTVQPLQPVYGGGSSDGFIAKISEIQPTLDHKLYFAQFGDGEGLLFSQIMLLNLDDKLDANVRILLKDPGGEALSVDLNGKEVVGELDTTVPASGLRVLRTDGLGSLASGSVTVFSDRELAGVILFSGVIGVAGVGSSLPLTEGFVAPMENNAAQSIRVGIAIMNLEEKPVRATLRLYNANGVLLATLPDYLVAAKGQEARFLDELFKQDAFPELDLSSLQGTLRVTADGSLAATVLQTRPGEFVTMPVAPLGAGDKKLSFAQFGDGEGLLFSQIMLYNLDANLGATAQLSLKDPAGLPLMVDLDGENVSGETEVAVPAGGLRVLRTDGVGDLASGSVSVSADQPLAGVILFGGSIGVAGVGSSVPLRDGFLAPMENNTTKKIRVGIAIMNLVDEPVSALLELFDEEGTLVATLPDLEIPARGQKAKFLDELFENADLSDFLGVLRVTASNEIAATVIQTRPGQFATIPVAPR